MLLVFLPVLLSAHLSLAGGALVKPMPARVTAEVVAAANTGKLAELSIVAPGAGSIISPSNCPQPAVCAKVPCPTSANWKNPLDYGAYGDGVHDDTLALREATAAGDACFPSGHTFLVGASGDSPQIDVNSSNKHWQAGMIGGEPPIIKQVSPLPACTTGGNCMVLRFNAGANFGSVIGLNWVGGAPTAAGGWTNWRSGCGNGASCEWDMAIRMHGDYGLFAGNSFSKWGGDGALEIVGMAGCARKNRVTYNKFIDCGLYGPVIVAGQNNVLDNNENTDCSEGAENDNLAQCTGGNVFDNETSRMIHGDGWWMTTEPPSGCGMILTGGSGAGADYSGNMISNSSISGAAGAKASCLYKSSPGGGAGAIYSNTSCSNGCEIH